MSIAEQRSNLIGLIAYVTIQYVLRYSGQDTIHIKIHVHVHLQVVVNNEDDLDTAWQQSQILRSMVCALRYMTDLVFRPLKRVTACHTNTCEGRPLLVYTSHEIICVLGMLAFTLFAKPSLNLTRFYRLIRISLS